MMWGRSAVIFRLGVVEFAVDLTQGMTSFPVLLEKSKRVLW